MRVSGSISVSQCYRAGARCREGGGEDLVRGGMLHRAWMDNMLNRTEACEYVYLLLIKVHEAPSPSPEKIRKLDGLSAQVATN